MNKQTKQFAINVLRRGSYKHWARWQATNKNKIGRNEYFCNECGVIGGRKDVQLDHIIPVIPVETGWDSFDGFIERLYCEVEGYAVLCLDCHKIKSHKENSQRPIGDRAKGKRKRKNLE